MRSTIPAADSLWRRGTALVGAGPVFAGADAKIPAAGSEIARVTEVARQLVRSPDLRGLTPRQRALIGNWNLPAATPLPPFTVFEKSVSQLQEAMTRGETTAEDIVREYLARLSTVPHLTHYRVSRRMPCI